MSKRALKTILVSIIVLIVAAIILCGWGSKTDEGWFKNPDVSTWFPEWREEIKGNTDKTEENHKHTFDTKSWKSDTDKHWHASTCGHGVKSDEAAHTYKDGVCTVCGYKQTVSDHEHTFDTKSWKSDKVNHWHASTCGCEVTSAAAAHTYKDGVCTVCGYKQTEENHVHTYNTEKWESDGINHWHASTCGHDIITDAAAHTFESGMCTVCGYVHLHTFDTTKWVSDNDNHWYAATCGHDINIALEPHTFKHGNCTVCGYEDPNHTHWYNAKVWESNNLNHWHPSLCGHDVVSSLESHTYKNGVCTVCGYKQG